MVDWRAAVAGIGSACVCACAKPHPGPSVAPASDPTGRPSDIERSSLIVQDPVNLVVTSGAIERQSDTAFTVRSAGMRAELGALPRDVVKIDFVYRGPSQGQAPLASGELRRQIGLKLRSQNSCNVVYAMWHIEPGQGLEASVKSNPGQSAHAQCGDRGYVFLKPASARAVRAIRTGEPHTLEAAIVGRELRIRADGELSWVAPLPAEAFAFNGPVGIRSDNGDFDVQLSAAAPSRADGSHE